MNATVCLKAEFDYLAPDGSQIYLLAEGAKGGLSQCVLPAGATSKATSHKTVEEIWYFLEGKGEVYREGIANGNPTPATAGTSLTIPLGTTFQFRNSGSCPLRFLIVTMPPWPGPSEATADAVGIW